MLQLHYWESCNNLCCCCISLNTFLPSVASGAGVPCLCFSLWCTWVIYLFSIQWLYKHFISSYWCRIESISCYYICYYWSFILLRDCSIRKSRVITIVIFSNVCVQENVLLPLASTCCDATSLNKHFCSSLRSLFNQGTWVSVSVWS